MALWVGLCPSGLSGLVPFMYFELGPLIAFIKSLVRFLLSFPLRDVPFIDFNKIMLPIKKGKKRRRRSLNSGLEVLFVFSYILVIKKLNDSQFSHCEIN